MRIFFISVTLLVFSSSLQSLTNYALTFTANSITHVRVHHTDTLSPVNGMTLEAWINAASLSGGPSIISKTEVGGYALYAASGYLRFDVRLNGFYQTVSFDASSLTGTWLHAACTTDGRYTKLYIDGELKHSVDAGNYYPIQYTYDNALIIGGEAGSGTAANGGFFSGSIDEVRIWDYARSPTEINAAMHTELTGNETGLIGYWNFNDGSGTAANDLTEYGQDGELINAPAWIVSDVSLPVELVSFSARLNGNDAELFWKTAMETNNLGFEVERREVRVSGLREDGQITNLKSPISNQNWLKIGFVEGNGTTATSQEYSFTDGDVCEGRYLFRLKQIDRDGHCTYSREIEVSVGTDPNGHALVQNFPNPFNPSTLITFSHGGNSESSGSMAGAHGILTIYNSAGQEVATLFDGFAERGKVHQVAFNALKLSGGMYFARFTVRGKTVVQKMVLLR